MSQTLLGISSYFYELTSSGGGAAGIGIGQHAKAVATAVTTTTPALTTQTSGSTFVIQTLFASGGTASSVPVSDNMGNFYVRAGTNLEDAPEMSLYYSTTHIGGAGHVFRASITASAELTMFALEISTAANSAYNVSSLAQVIRNATTTFFVTSGPLDQDVNMMILGLGTDSGSNPATVSTIVAGWTKIEEELNGAANWTGALFARKTAASTAVGFGASVSGANNGVLTMFALRE